VNLYDLLGYFSGLYFIRTDIPPTVLVRTLAVVHLLDAILCRHVAARLGRNQRFWGLAGLLLGMWAVASLFFLSYKKPTRP
jgi:hypothetical protein